METHTRQERVWMLSATKGFAGDNGGTRLVMVAGGLGHRAAVNTWMTGDEGTSDSADSIVDKRAIYSLYSIDRPSD